MRQPTATPPLPERPDHQRQCLVRFAIAMRIKKGSSEAHDWLDAYEQKSKDKTLRTQVVEQWQRGNRGRPGEWIE
jgi:hypothetical protein